MKAQQVSKSGEDAVVAAPRTTNHFIIVLLGVAALGGVWVLLFLRFVSYQASPTRALQPSYLNQDAAQFDNPVEGTSSDPGASIQRENHALPMVEFDSTDAAEDEDNAEEPALELESLQSSPSSTDSDTSRTVPRIAFVVDDLGYGLEAFEILESQQVPLTMAILPQIPYSQEIARRANAAGFEVILHLPMEPVEAAPTSPGRLTLDMTPGEVASMMEADLDTVPYAVGVNNHQGSKATQNRDFMASVMEYVAERGLYFLDSRTTPRTVAEKVGQEFGVRTASNRLFLDNVKSLDDVRGQIERLMTTAKKHGSAIGILHAHVVSTTTLVELLPEVEEAGIELVYVSELVKR